jgi:putative membrane protein
MMGWNGGMMYGFGAGMGLIGWLVQLALIVALIYLAVILIRKLTGSANESKKSESILKERFARGEISEEEYERMKKILHQ